MMRTSLLLLLSLALLVACDDPPADPAPAPEPAPVEVEEPEPEPDQTEACVRGIVVSWQGAPHAADTVTRSQTEARARAEALLARVEAGESIATLATTESDGRSSAARGGVLGTFAREDWPALHAALEGPVFQLQEGMKGPVVEAPYGYVVFERCPVEKIHTRHLLVRYAGARNAPDDLERSSDAARELAEAYRRAAIGGESLEALAREHSEDSSAERGGDLGPVGRGLLAPTYEAAAFALESGGISEVVETPFGFHVIQRVE